MLCGGIVPVSCRENFSRSVLVNKQQNERAPSISSNDMSLLCCDFAAHNNACMVSMPRSLSARPWYCFGPSSTWPCIHRKSKWTKRASKQFGFNETIWMTKKNHVLFSCLHRRHTTTLCPKGFWDSLMRRRSEADMNKVRTQKHFSAVGKVILQ